VSSDDVRRAIADDVGSGHRELGAALRSALPPRSRSVEGWSPAQLLAHVTAWKANAIEVARRLDDLHPTIDPSAGTSRILGIPDVDVFNADVAQQHATSTLEDVSTWSDTVHRDLLHALATTPIERLTGGPYPNGAVGWLFIPAVEHPREHLEALRR
jgi:hypothetical protein